MAAPQETGLLKFLCKAHMIITSTNIDDMSCADT